MRRSIRRYKKTPVPARTMELVNAGAFMAMAAHALGLGCCWVKLCKDDDVLRILRVPAGHYMAGILAIGYPDECPAARPRLPLSELVHYDTF